MSLLYFIYSAPTSLLISTYLEMVVVQYCSRLQTRGIFFGILALVGLRFLGHRTTCIHVKANLSFNIRAMYLYNYMSVAEEEGREASHSPRVGLPIDQF